MSGLRFLDLVKPFSPFLPEIISAETKVCSGIVHGCVAVIVLEPMANVFWFARCPFVRR
jgi:hypothetical protein